MLSKSCAKAYLARTLKVNLHIWRRNFWDRQGGLSFSVRLPAPPPRPHTNIETMSVSGNSHKQRRKSCQSVTLSFPEVSRNTGCPLPKSFPETLKLPRRRHATFWQHPRMTPSLEKYGCPLTWIQVVSWSWAGCLSVRSWVHLLSTLTETPHSRQD